MLILKKFIFVVAAEYYLDNATYPYMCSTKMHWLFKGRVNRKLFRESLKLVRSTPNMFMHPNIRIFITITHLKEYQLPLKNQITTIS